MRGSALVGLVPLLAGLVILGVGVGSQLSTNGNNGKDHLKVTLCHATSSDKNPFVQITVDIASVKSAQTVGGHDKHDNKSNGTGFTGDIIPAYTFGSVSYPGKNLTAEGIDIYEDGCKVVNDDNSPSPSPKHSPKPTPCGEDTDKECPSPSPKHSPSPSVTPTPTPSLPGTGGKPTPTPALPNTGAYWG